MRAPNTPPAERACAGRRFSWLNMGRLEMFWRFGRFGSGGRVGFFSGGSGTEGMRERPGIGSVYCDLGREFGGEGVVDLFVGGDCC